MIPELLIQNPSEDLFTELKYGQNMDFPTHHVINITNDKDDTGASSWENALSQIKVDINSPYGVHLVKKLTEHFYQILPLTLLVEANYTDKDFRSLYYHHYSKIFREVNRHSIRIHVFKGVIHESLLLPPALIENDNYQGYLCLSIPERPLLGRTILKFNPENTRDFICKTSFSARIFGTTCKIQGFPFIWQDSEMICCAHATL
jgi:hypothetical protein